MALRATKANEDLTTTAARSENVGLRLHPRVLPGSRLFGDELGGEFEPDCKGTVTAPDEMPDKRKSDHPLLTRWKETGVPGAIAV